MVVPICFSGGANTCLDSNTLTPVPGYFCKADVCYQCPIGTYGVGGNSCVACPFATWSRNTGSTSCGTMSPSQSSIPTIKSTSAPLTIQSTSAPTSYIKRVGGRKLKKLIWTIIKYLFPKIWNPYECEIRIHSYISASGMNIGGDEKYSTI